MPAIPSLLLILATISPSVASALDDHDPVVFVYKDGHRQTLAAGFAAR